MTWMMKVRRVIDDLVESSWKDSQQFFLFNFDWLTRWTESKPMPRKPIDPGNEMIRSEFASNSTCMIFDIGFFLVGFFRVEFTVSRIVRSFVTAIQSCGFPCNWKEKRIRRRKRRPHSRQIPILHRVVCNSHHQSDLFERARRRQRYHRIDTLSIQM